MDSIITPLIELFNKYKGTYLGLLVGLSLLLIICLSFIDPFLEKGVSSFFTRVLIYLATLIVCMVVWDINFRRWPRNKTKKLGIYLVINAESDRENLLIKKDLLNDLKTKIEANNLTKHINFQNIPDYQTERAIEILSEGREVLALRRQPGHENTKFKKSFEEFIKKTNGVFYIFGTFTKRLEGKDRYRLNLNSLVLHRIIPMKYSDNLANEMSKIFPSKLEFDSDREISGLQLTASTLSIASRYIIAMAVQISAKFELAFDLLKELDNDIRNQYAGANLPNIDQVRTSTRRQLAMLSVVIGNRKHKKGQNKEALKLNEYALVLRPHFNDALIQKSVFDFAINKNPKESLKAVLRAKRIRNGDFTWMYNKAFLQMYQGQFEKGLKSYEDAIAVKNFDNNRVIVQQCIDFNVELLRSEPKKTQCLFIVGFLYLKRYENYPMALEYFESFISEASGKSEFKFLMRHANDHAESIRATLGV